MPRKIEIKTSQIFSTLIYLLILYILLRFLLSPLPFFIKIPLIFLEEMVLEPYTALFFIIYRFIPKHFLWESSGWTVLRFPSTFAILIFLFEIGFLLPVSYVLKRVINRFKNPKRGFFIIIGIFLGILTLLRILSTTIYILQCRNSLNASLLKARVAPGDVLYFHFDKYLKGKKQKTVFMDFFGFETIFYAENKDLPNKYDVAYLYPYNEGKFNFFCFLKSIDIIEQFRPLPKNKSTEIKLKYNLE